jgi:outer membrane cobalamin receptor
VIDDHDFWGFTDYGVNALAKFTPTPEIDTYLGYDYQNYAGNDVVLVIDKKTEHVHAVFGEVATTPAFISNVRFAAGFRHNAPSVGQSATVWNVTGRWDVTPEFFVKGMVGTAFRLPTAEELFANDPNDERGNPDTKPEQSTNINASVGGNFGMRAIRWEVIGFARDIKNLIGLADFDSVTNQDVFGNVPGTVRVRGVEVALDAVFTPDISGSFSYTRSEAKDSTHLQIRRVPEQLAKATLDYHPMNMPFGLFASVNYVGDVFETVGGVRQKYGDDLVVDIGGRVFLDMSRHHRIDVNLQNVFDEDYATHLTRGFPDDGGPAYLVGFRGLPRTLSLHYSYNFF